MNIFNPSLGYMHWKTYSKSLSESTISKFLILREKYRFIIIDTDIIIINEITKFVGDMEGTRYNLFPNAGISNVKI